MPFMLRPYRRFPVHCFLSYSCGPFKGIGTVWNISITGWRLSGDLPLRTGENCSLTVSLPNEQTILVEEAVVRWVRENEYGLETKTLDRHARARHVSYALCGGIGAKSHWQHNEAGHIIGIGDTAHEKSGCDNPDSFSFRHKFFCME